MAVAIGDGFHSEERGRLGATAFSPAARSCTNSPAIRTNQQHLRLEGAAGVCDTTVVGLADTFEAGGQTVQMSLQTMAAIYGVRTDSQLVIKASTPPVTH